MDQQHVLYYTIIFIWLLPFTFGKAKFHRDLLNTCLNGKFHKEIPSVESELFEQCSPWKNRSCCTSSTSTNVHKPMHYNFNIDHCSNIKPLSEECRKYFIQDLCFYECSPNVGPWLVQVKMKIRKERFFNVPLCKSDCTKWYNACRDDFTCNGNWLRGWKWSSAGNSCPQNAMCQKIEEIFHNFTNFCEKVWDHSWKVVLDNKPCMHIWFNSTEGNPNDAVAKYYFETKTSSFSSSSSKSMTGYLLCDLALGWVLIISRLVILSRIFLRTEDSKTTRDRERDLSVE